MARYSVRWMAARAVVAALVLAAAGAGALAQVSPVAEGAGKPRGSKGDLVGLWEVNLHNNPRAAGVLRTIEFRADGTFAEENGPKLARPCYRTDGRALVLLDDRRICQGGDVEWLDDDRFTFTVRIGQALRDPRGTVYLFRRVTAGADKEKQGDLVGVWEAREKSRGKEVRYAEFAREGTYTLTGVALGKEGEYRYRNGTLHFGAAGGWAREAPYNSGAVAWLDRDSFELTVVADRMFRDQPGTTFVFRREEAGKKDGKIVGVWEWEGKDVRPRVYGIVEFQADGGFDQVTFSGGGGGLSLKDFARDSEWTYTLAGGKLRVCHEFRSVKAQEHLRGVVRWLDTDAFELKVTFEDRNRDFRTGKEYVFRRRSLEPDKAKEGKLAGTWFIREGTRLISRVVFNPDGTYKGPPIGQEGGRGLDLEGTSYICKQGILALEMTIRGDRVFRLQRGAIEWVDKDVFRVQLLDGRNVDAETRAKVYEFRRE